ncbi:hypothetical protein GGR51DRAFT_566827 [Nemania sp. FL0031]|nr:hypothetical protein GGR51DRAFT_566827 [Nemania sp. FL0031]
MSPMVHQPPSQKRREFRLARVKHDDRPVEVAIERASLDNPPKFTALYYTCREMKDGTTVSFSRRFADLGSRLVYAIRARTFPSSFFYCGGQKNVDNALDEFRRHHTAKVTSSTNSLFFAGWIPIHAPKSAKLLISPMSKEYSESGTPYIRMKCVLTSAREPLDYTHTFANYTMEIASTMSFRVILLSLFNYNNSGMFEKEAVRIPVGGYSLLPGSVLTIRSRIDERVDTIELNIVGSLDYIHAGGSCHQPGGRHAGSSH